MVDDIMLLSMGIEVSKNEKVADGSSKAVARGKMRERVELNEWISSREVKTSLNIYTSSLSLFSKC